MTDKSHYIDTVQLEKSEMCPERVVVGAYSLKHQRAFGASEEMLAAEAKAWEEAEDGHPEPSWLAQYRAEQGA